MQSDKNLSGLNVQSATIEGLTPEECQRCDDAFKAFDKDGSGFIDAQELRIVLEMMG